MAISGVIFLNAANAGHGPDKPGDAMTARNAGQSPHTSVVIPVYNKWELTENCLRSLAATLAGNSCEIIVVDNASSDATREACPALGQALFGELFRYHPRRRTSISARPPTWARKLAGANTCCS